MEHIARAAAGHGGDRVDEGFAIDPDALAHGGEQRVHLLALRRAASLAGVQARHAQPELGRRVGHGAHDTGMAVQPLRQGREIDPRRDADHRRLRA
ncbi:hypothetical protein WJ973_07145 [Achromobacter xylosoxidans]